MGIKNVAKLLKPALLLCCCLLPFTAKADVDWLMLIELIKQTGLQQQLQGISNKTMGFSEKTLQQLVNTAGADYANRNYNPTLQSWGTGTDNWKNVVNLYQQGGSGLGAVASQLNRDFPIQPASMIHNDPSSPAAKYYTLQAETALAARAASQLDYDNIKKQIEYMHQLHDMIGQTKTVKDAVDLQNRLQVEGNLIQLEVLRLAALSNQQQAVTTQGGINAVINNVKAFQ